MKIKNFTAIIQQEDNGYVSFCPELDIASQGNTIQEAKMNLSEAIQLFFEIASSDEINERLSSEIYMGTPQGSYYSTILKQPIENTIC